MLDDRIPGDAHEGALGRVILVGGLRRDSRERREGLGGTADPQHDAEKYGEHADSVVVGIAVVRDEFAQPYR